MQGRVGNEEAGGEEGSVNQSQGMQTTVGNGEGGVRGASIRARRGEEGEEWHAA